MARPREFDIDDAIDGAMLVFWERGYEDAGLTELCTAMGITRGSFYKAFPSKKALFLEVLKRYERDQVTDAVVMLKSAEGDGRERIRRVFDSGLAASRSGDARGCLLCNTASGPALSDPAIRDAVATQLHALTMGFAAALEEDPRFAGGDDARRLAEAHRLTMSYVGLRVLGRGAADLDALEEGVAAVLSPHVGTAPASLGNA